MTKTNTIQWLKRLWKQEKSLVAMVLVSGIVTMIAVNTNGLFGAHFSQRYTSPSSITKAQSSSSSVRSRVSLKQRAIARAKSAASTAPRLVFDSFETPHMAAPQEASSLSTLRYTVHPVSKVPNWGAMRTASEWNRAYGDMKESDFVAVPPYHLSSLTIPLSSLTTPITQASIPLITAKLYYSTRYMSNYDLDADEHSGTHDGVDLKLALDTPVGSIGGGKVIEISEDGTLGLHVLIEHELTSGERYLSIYGHLATTLVTLGQTVAPGQIIGTVGMTGNTSGPHLHLGLHRKIRSGSWNEYDATESVNPMTFITQYAGGE